MQLLSEYDKKKLSELERKKQSGTLDKNMEPLYRWLKGDRRYIYKTKDHQKACKLINDLNKEYTLPEIAEHTECSTSTIQRLASGAFKKTARATAERIYQWLRSAQKKGEL